MKSKAFAALMGAAMVVGLSTGVDAQQQKKPAGNVKVSLVNNGAPMAAARVFLQVANLGKVPVGVTDDRGQATFALNIANLGKVPMEIYVEDCPSGSDIVITEPGSMPEADRNCSRRRAGAWVWGSKCLSVDVATGKTLKCGGFFNARNIALISAGVATAVILTSMGGDDQAMTPETPRTPSAPQAPPAATPQTTPVQNPPATTPNLNGTYVTEITCTNDPSNHNPHIGLAKVRSVTVVITGTNIRITGSDPWVNTSGTYDPATGAFKTTGVGTVAGRPNVTVIFNGTLNPGSPSSKPRVSGAATMGANGELPGGQATTYTVFGNQ